MKIQTPMTKYKQIMLSPKTMQKYFLLLIGGVILVLFFEMVKIQNIHKAKENGRPKYWVYSLKSNANKRDGFLQNVHTVLERLGYEKSTNETPWNLVWSDGFFFHYMYPKLHNLKPHQKVNHMPGIGNITSKVNLATTDLKFIPKAFRLPKDKDKFLKYASERKNALFVVKNNGHRGVALKNVSEINLDKKTTFVQEYVQNPFLVDGHKFDIGVYVVLTSVDPLRVYIYKGDVAFRYCPKPYLPFDAADRDRYVVSDDYLPVWKVPSLKNMYTNLRLTMKEGFDTYVRSKGKDPAKIWEGVEKAITEVFIVKEKNIVDTLNRYPSKDNFFEMVRVDLIVDEDLEVYLLEANMGPNLSHRRFPPNKLLFEQVLYNLFNLVGVASPLNGYHSQDSRDSKLATFMVTADKNIAVWGSECNRTCAACGDGGVCALCRGCLSQSPELRRSLFRAHTEHLHRGDFRRLYPKAMTPIASLEDLEDLEGLTPANKLQHFWYQGKCNTDVTWCT